MDRQLRRLERAALTGDPEAIAQLEAARYRVLDIPHDHLELLAHLGFEPAQHRLGWKAAKPQSAKPEPYQIQSQPTFKTPAGLTKRSVTTVVELRDLMDRWQKPTNVRIALYACEAVEPKFAREMQTDYLQRVIASVQRWLDASDEDRTTIAHRECRPISDENYSPPEHDELDMSSVSVLGAGLGDGMVSMPPPHVISRSMHGASQLARTTFADQTTGRHDLPGHITVAHQAGNAVAFARQVENDTVVCNAIRNRMREWVVDEAMKRSTIF